jgi:hypothetical protein
VASARCAADRSMSMQNRIACENPRPGRWRLFGFHVFCGNHISPNDETAMENLACYIIRASLSQEPMQYLDQGRANRQVLWILKATTIQMVIFNMSIFIIMNKRLSFYINEVLSLSSGIVYYSKY